MEPTKEWLVQWERLRLRMTSPVDLNQYFEQREMMGRQLVVMDIGDCSLPSGHIMVCDPLYYLQERDNQPYFLAVAPGTYCTEICVVQPQEPGECARYAAVRLRFSEQPAVSFQEALTGSEALKSWEEGSYFGFPVDAGLGCICDQVLHQAFCDFVENWQREHPEGNLYDDYFAALFAASYQTHGEWQREGGDWLNWVIPGTGYHLPIFQSGFGDGAYPVYWGYAADGTICQLVIHFIDIELAYGEWEEED